MSYAAASGAQRPQPARVHETVAEAGNVKSDQLQKIRQDADTIQLAVELLLSDPRFGRECRPELRFFLRNRLNNTDFDTLNRLTLRGQTRFLAGRFFSYLARR